VPAPPSRPPNRAVALRRGLPLAALAVAALLAAGCGGAKKDASAGAASTGANGCRAVSAPQPDERTAPKPSKRLDASKTYELTLHTNCGDFTIRLDVGRAPATAASLVSLARRGYFDHTTFHRIVPGFVIQGGDPTGSGAGGPGYQTVDKPPASVRYTHGVVAMAKTQTEPPGTSGSQFFVVTGKDIGLPADYAVVGRVTKGLDVVDRIGGLGDPTTEQPSETVEIEKATVRVS
jgi:peptidyl-prolyl cis-trans isomerase B (cyclophilin B)